MSSMKKCINVLKLHVTRDIILILYLNNIFICFCKGSLTQAIRNFAKSLENWLKGAMTGVPEEMVKTKVRCTLLLHFKIKRVSD